MIDTEPNCDLTISDYNKILKLWRGGQHIFNFPLLISQSKYTNNLLICRPCECTDHELSVIKDETNIDLLEALPKVRKWYRL